MMVRITFSALAHRRGDNYVRLWDIAAGKQLHQLPGHRANVHHVRLSSDGALVASTSQDRTVRLWHVATGKPFIVHETETASLSLAFSPDGRTLALTAGKTVTLWGVPETTWVHGP